MNRCFCQALCVGAFAALLGGCGGSQAALGASPQPLARNKAAVRPAPESALLYVADQTGTIRFYSYPQLERKGALTGFSSPRGLCSDLAGDVYVTDYQANLIYEYRHGRKHHARVLKLPFAKRGPFACSVDPTTGDLAVVSYYDGLFVYKAASGTPVEYESPRFDRYYYAAYDNSGDLFVDGTRPDNNFRFVLGELPHSASTIEALKVNRTLRFPGGVFWDGQHLAVADYYDAVVYEFSISGKDAIEAGSTPLQSGAQQIGTFYIDGTTLIAPSLGYGTSDPPAVLFFDYPQGGTATKSLTRGVGYPAAVTISR